MRIGRTIPPAAAPLDWRDLCSGIAGFFSGARAIQALEDEIRREFGVAHVFLVSSGKAAVTIAIEALQSLSPRREVVIPAYTCFSVPAAVLKAGARPVICDIDARTFDFDAADLGAAVGDRTLCVIAQHLFGIPAALGPIRDRCRAAGAFLVEDAAQAMGAESEGRRLGTIGDDGIFSLGRGKNITCGSGGIIVTSSDVIAAAIRARYAALGTPSAFEQVKDFVRVLLMTIFIRPRLYWMPASLPFLGLGRTIFPKEIPLARLSAMKAGLLRRWRRQLARSNQARAEAAAYFARTLPVPGAPRASYPYLRLPFLAASAAERDRIVSASRARGLGVSVAYPTPIDEIPEVRAVCDSGRFPAARNVSRSLFTLPTHQWLSAADKRAIVELCRGARAA